MAKSKLAKKGETREEFDERVKDSILKPETEDSHESMARGSDGSIPPPPSGSDQGPEPGKAFRVGIIKQELSCILTPEELHERSLQLANMNIRINAEKGRQSQIKKELNRDMEALEKEWANLSTAVMTGEGTRTVDVAIELLGDGETVSEIRQDTLKPINTRPATDFERQGQLFPASDLFNDHEQEGPPEE